MTVIRSLSVAGFLAVLLLAGAISAFAEDLSSGPFYIDEVFEVPADFDGCKPMPASALAKTAWHVPYGSVTLEGDGGSGGVDDILLHKRAFMLEEETGVSAVDGYDDLLAVEHDGSLAEVLVPGNVVAGSFGIREVVGVVLGEGVMADFNPTLPGSETPRPRRTVYRGQADASVGYFQVKTREAGWSDLLCAGDFVVRWDPIPAEFQTTPSQGDCEGHSPCDVVFPLPSDEFYEAPTFDPYAPEGGAQARDGGVFDCKKPKPGSFQIKPSLRVHSSSLSFTVSIRRRVAKFEGSTNIDARLLVSLQEDAPVKQRCEADFLRMLNKGRPTEVKLATFPVFGVPVSIYLKPFIIGYVEVTSDIPRLEVDLSASLVPTLAVGWDRGPIADFDLNPDFDADVRMAPASASNPWAAKLEAGVDLGAELGVSTGFKVFGVGADIKLFVKPYQKYAAELTMSSHKPCTFDLDATVAVKLKFGIKLVLKVIFNILSIHKESLPISLGPTLNLANHEHDLAAFGCPEEPDFEIPLGGVDGWQCAQDGALFGGLNARDSCLQARANDPRCAATGANPHGTSCSPIGAEQNLCSPCTATGVGGTWRYTSFECVCGTPSQACDYPCCVTHGDCVAGEFCTAGGVCQPNCIGSGGRCESTSDCCDGECACIFDCGLGGLGISACVE